MRKYNVRKLQQHLKDFMLVGVSFFRDQQKFPLDRPGVSKPVQKGPMWGQVFIPTEQNPHLSNWKLRLERKSAPTQAFKGWKLTSSAEHQSEMHIDFSTNENYWIGHQFNGVGNNAFKSQLHLSQFVWCIAPSGFWLQQPIMNVVILNIDSGKGY